MKLIGICGRKRAGKDTAASALVTKGYRLVRFADPLKNMIRTLLGAAGIFCVEHFIEGDQKEIPLPALCGKSTRFAMQTLGTEWGRKTIGEDLWIQVALSRVAGLPAAVISDVRFPNEAAAIRNIGGTIIKIVRSEQPQIDGHASEASIDLIDAQYTIINNSTIQDLQAKILSIAEKL